MSVLPTTRLSQIQFCEDHLPVWSAAPAAAIGLTSAQITALSELTEAARAAYNAAQAARQAGKTATMVYTSATAQMRTLAGDMVSQIKAFADLSGDATSVYEKAQIPPPAAPTPATAPGKPTDFSVVLQPTGAVTLRWNAENSAASSGGFFNVLRKLPGQAGFSPIGGAPGSTAQSRTMSFTDTTVPTSAAGQGAQYIVQGQRGTLLGLPSDAITVQFGVDGTGTFSVGSQTGALKMAA
ncbi:MAG: hypothetical protein KF768_09955 [Phycisphaeraceae bacterium]|nr:hypothetical protein [Phycisphaeraceae bacterium]